MKQLLLADSQKEDPSLRRESEEVQSETDDIYTLETQKKCIFLKQRNYETGAKLAKVLAYKLCKQQADSTIYRI